MKSIYPVVLAAFAALFSGCVASHVKMEIPPPGGCDQCHRQKIADNWEIAVTPVFFGKEGGVPQPSDLALQSVQAVPYHRQVSEKRLAIFAASAPAESFGDEESGVQCFVCHETPSPPHEKIRGHHPWGRGAP